MKTNENTASKSFKVWGSHYWEPKFLKLIKLNHVKAKVVSKPNSYDKTALMVLHGKTAFGYIGDDDKAQVLRLYPNAVDCYVDVTHDDFHNKYIVTLTIDYEK